MNQEPAITDVLSAIILIAVVVGAMSVTGLYLTQNAKPSQLPVMNFESCIKNNDTLYLYHTGGDPLVPRENASDFYLNLLDSNQSIIDSKPMMPWLTNTWASGDPPLQIGTELNPVNSAKAKYVQLVSKTGGGENLIEWTQINSCTGSLISDPSCLSRTLALFSANPKTGDAPLTVSFTDESQAEDNNLYPITSWNWDFGDGNSSTNRTPTNTYYVYGEFQVRLRVANACGSDEITLPITVATGICPEITASFITEPTDLTITGSNLTVNFTDTSSPSSNITKWEWDFGDGTPTEIMYTPGASLSHTYSRGVYWATLTVYNGCGKWSVSYKQISVMTNDDCLITPNFNATPTSGFSPLMVEFTDLSSTNRGQIESWYWDFGNGNTTTLQKPPNQTYIYDDYGSKTFIVNLTVTNSCGAIGNTTTPITINCPPVTADFTPNLTSGRLPLTIKCTDNSTGKTITNWNWTFGDDSTTYNYTAIQNPPDHTFTKTGLFPVNLTVTNYCGNSSRITKYINLTCQNVTTNFTEIPESGYPSLFVNFTDTSSGGNITGWQWDFGDGNSSVSKNPNHTYYSPGNYTVNLTSWNDCLSSDSKEKNITVQCPSPNASFDSVITDYTHFTAQFYDTSSSSPVPISSRWWEFGDGKTSSDKNPKHEYGGKPANYTVNLTVTNKCGTSNTTTFLLNPDCTHLIAGMDVSPLTGSPPLVVSFKDNSTPIENVTSRRWIFGDVKPDANASLRNTTHTYENIGTYYVTLLVENECGVASATEPQIITVTRPANISGHLWEDWTLSKTQDYPSERNLNASSGFKLELWEVTGTGTNYISNTSPDSNGNYSFQFSASNGVYQITERPPAGQIWRSTYPYDSEANANVSSDNLLIMSTRNYSNVNFGNAEWHKSNVTVPLCFRYNPYNQRTHRYDWTDQCSATKKFDFRTSFDNAVKTLTIPTYNKNILIPDVNYSAWGRSNFTLIPGVYNIYFKNDNEGFYFLEWWRYNGVNVSVGTNLTVPDNTYYDRSRLTYWFPGGSRIYFVISQPQENEVIPYSTTSYLEAHYVGPYEDRSNGAGGCYIRWVGTDSKSILLKYSATLGYNSGTWDNSKYEGQKVNIVVNDTLKNSARTIISTNRTVTVDWQLITVAITKVTSDTGTNQEKNRGIVRVNATVTGKNRDASTVTGYDGSLSNVTLLINGTYAGKMTRVSNISSSEISTYTITFDAEKYAGKKFPIAVLAPYKPFIGKSVTSEPRSITALSKNSLIANFSADPWSGPAPLEVAFSDTSSGGPTSWSWNFGDNTTSSLQNPIKTFANQSLFNITLQVSNATDGPVSATKQINVTGKLHDVMFYTTRSGSLMPGGWMQWITSGTDQYQVVNNTTYNFANYDTIRNTLPESLSSARILVSGGISELNLTNVTLSINDVVVASGNSSKISTGVSKNFHSTMNLNAAASDTAVVTLLWDGVYQYCDSESDITLFNLMPTTVSTMDLNMSSDEIFFQGRATEYSN